MVLRESWDAWKTGYRCQLTCRKCGSVWEVYDKKGSQAKRCPRCVSVGSQMSKRSYEAWKPLSIEYLFETFEGLHPGTLSARAVADVVSREGVRYAMSQFGLGYSQARALFLTVYDEEAYCAVVSRGNRRSIRAAHVGFRRWWDTLSTEGRVEHFQRLTGPSSLEALLVGQLAGEGVSIRRRNAWYTFGTGIDRQIWEADLQLCDASGRVVVVQCDGEAFHGLDTVFIDPRIKAASDTQSDQSFLARGYSVVRFSGSEIKSGEALSILLETVLPCSHQLSRNWHPKPQLMIH